MKKTALIIGIRNHESICYYIAKELKKNGYQLYATYLDDSSFDTIKQIANEIGIEKIYQYNASITEELISFTDEIKKDGIKLDCIVHGIAYSGDPKSHLTHLMDISWEDFASAIRIGAFSLVEVIGKLIDHINDNASIITLTSRLSKLAIPGFNVIGAAKASLDSIIRGLAESLGRLKKIRVNAVAPGPVPTKSLSKFGNVMEILSAAKKRSPLKRNISKEDVGRLTCTLIENKSITGTIYTIDGGMDIMGA